MVTSIALTAFAQEQAGSQSISLAGAEVHLDRLLSLTKEPMLRQLKLQQASLTDQDLASLASLPSLEELILEKCEFSDQLFLLLTDCKKIKRLRLRSLRFADATLKALAMLSRLELLELTDCTGYSERGLEGLAQLTKLRSLTLSGSVVRDSVLLQWKGLTNLTSLALRQTEVTNEGLRVLEHFVKLKELDVYGTPVSTGFLKQIPYPANLTKLKLRASKIASTEIVDGIARFVNVNGIDLGENAVDDAALVSIAQLVKLEDLNLLRTKLSANAVQILSKSPNSSKWKKLNLDDNPGVNDTSIDFLLGMKSLEFLHVGKTQVTDAGIAKLASLDQLKTLIVNDTTVTQEALQLLQDKLPKLRIVR